jgi:phosphatidylglycerophosphate synthase
MWCDNADGAHARRTNQCSAFGEFLDHGLDQLNTVYIAYLTAMALGLSPVWWVIIAFIIPGAGAVTYWEQSQTGIFRLGLLNQVESLTVLSTALTISAFLGTSWWQKTSLFGICSIQTAILAWSASTILFGKVRSMFRVAQARGFAAVLPVACLLAFGGAIVLADALGAINTITAVALCTGANVYFGMRMLSHRLHGENPRIEGALVAGTVALLALIAWARLGNSVSASVNVGLAIVVCGVFGVYAIGDTRRSIVHLDTLSAR